MHPFQAALDTCLDSPFFASLSVHGLHFTVYAPSTNSLTKVLTKMHTGVYMRLRTPPRVLTGNLTVLTKTYTKDCSVNFHMSYFDMFFSCPYGFVYGSKL